MTMRRLRVSLKLHNKQNGYKLFLFIDRDYNIIKNKCLFKKEATEKFLFVGLCRTRPIIALLLSYCVRIIYFRIKTQNKQLIEECLSKHFDKMPHIQEVFILQLYLWQWF